MAKQITYQPLSDIGLNGLNTQSNPATLDSSFLTKAENVVIRESGRIAFRKGFKQKVAPSGAPIGSIIEHNDQGTLKIFASHGTSIFTVDFTDTDAAFPSSGANVKRTVANSTGNWQFVNFNKRLHCFHAGVSPQRYDGSSDTGERWSAHYNTTALNGAINNSVTTITVDSTVGFPPNGRVIIESEVISYTGITATTFTGLTRSATDAAAASHADNLAVVTATAPAGVPADGFNPSCGMGYYGRLWCGGVAAAPDIVYWSNLLDGDDWLGGDAGAIDLSTIWGTDEIVAIEPYFGKLIIFGKYNIVVYNSPTAVGSLALDEVIRGVGCVSRDSIKAIGDDLVFCSSTGLRSLARTTQNDKIPLQDLSVNIKDTLIRNIGQSTNIKSVYVENEGIYIMTFPVLNITYVFDFKHYTPNNAPRVTTWIFDNDREPSSMVYTDTYGLLVGQKDGGLAGYEGYYDIDLAANGTTFSSSSYTSNIETTWVNLGESISSTLLKRLFIVLEGGSGANLGVKWYKDYSPSPSETTQITLNPVTTGSTSLWGANTSRYGTTTVTHTHVAADHPSNSTYAPVFGLNEYKTPLTGSAKNLKLAISIESNGYDASLQDLILLHKQGKIR
tara:strand:+ start:643 stop:2490 length:1848 start_codon:yes stop_codon:yes gene_type:complete